MTQGTAGFAGAFFIGPEDGNLEDRFANSALAEML